MFIIPSTVRAVLFDAVGTLLQPDPSVVVAYAAAGRRHGSTLSEDDLQQRFRQAFSRQEGIDATQPGQATSEEREERRWRQIVAEVFPDVANGEQLFAELWDHFAQPGHWRLFDDAAAAWRKLAQRGLVLGVASNFDARLERLCAGLPPLDDCRHVFVSSRVGIRKPGLGLFRAIELALRLPPENLLLIGDDLQNDYLAARAAGWQAVLVSRAQPVVEGAAHIVRSLLELEP